MGLISKKATLHVQHTLFVHFFAVVLHDYNVKLYGGNVVRVLVHYFFYPAHFHLGGRYKLFMLFFQQKSLLCLLFLALAVCCPFFL